MCQCINILIDNSGSKENSEIISMELLIIAIINLLKNIYFIIKHYLIIVYTFWKLSFKQMTVIKTNLNYLLFYLSILISSHS